MNWKSNYANIKNHHKQMSDCFKFMHLPENEFFEIFKQVKRERQFKREVEKWEKFQQSGNQKKGIFESKVSSHQTECVKYCLINDNERSRSFHEVIKSFHPSEKLNESSSEFLVPTSTSCPYEWINGTKTSLPDQYKSPGNYFSQEKEFSNCKSMSFHPELENHIKADEMGIVKVKDDNPNLFKSRTRTASEEKVSPVSPCLSEDFSLFEIEYKKVEDLKSRIVSVLQNISVLINDDIEISEDDGLHRLRKRTLEFSTRFTRNYNYQFKRQVDEIEKELRNPSDTLKIRKLLYQKTLSCFQIAIQALQAFEKHLPTCFIDGAPSPIMEFLTRLKLLSSLAEEIYGKKCNDDGEIRNLCDSLFVTLKEEKKYTETEKKELTKTKGPKNKTDNLWMYSSNLKSIKWKSKTKALAREKFGPPSKQNELKKGFKGELVKMECLKPEHSKEPTLADNGTQDSDILPHEVLSTPHIENTKTSPFDSTGKELIQEQRCLENYGLQQKNLQYHPRRESSRNSTRGIYEDQVETMMENIPHDSVNCNDACSFLSFAVTELREVLKVLKESKDDAMKGEETNSRKCFKDKNSQNNVKLVFVEEGVFRKKDESKKINGSDESKNDVTPICQDVANDYVKKFTNYKKSNPFYQLQNDMEPWEIIARIGDKLLSELTEEVSYEIESRALVNKLFDLELNK